MRVVTMDPNKCVVCRNCEYACAFKQKGDFKRKDSNIRVNYYPQVRVCIPMTCIHCNEPWCMEVCPARAINRNEETGAVEIDQNRCAGCKMCMLSCPFGNIHFDPDKLVSRKCNLCEGDPNCVKFCIAGALQYEEVDEAFKSKRKNFDSKLRTLLEAMKNDGKGVK